MSDWFLGLCPFPDWWLALNVILIIISSIILMHISYALYHFIRANINDKNRASKGRIATGVMVIISSLILFIAFIGQRSALIYCPPNWNLFIYIGEFYHLTWPIQTWLLLLIYYQKLNNIFKGTSYQISKCQDIYYKTIFVLLPVLVFTSVTLKWFGPPNSHLTVVQILFLTVLISTISLIVSIINRLRKCYKDTVQVVNDDNKTIINAITKLTILSSFSVSISFLYTLFTVINVVTEFSIKPLGYVFYFVMILECYTNFVFGIMSFKAFGNYYDNVCQCMHIKCTKCWTRILNPSAEHIKNLEAEITVTSTTTSTTN